MHSLRSTSGATPVDLLMASIAAGHFPTCISRGGSWLVFEPITSLTTPTTTNDYHITSLVALVGSLCTVTDTGCNQHCAHYVSLFSTK